MTMASQENLEIEERQRGRRRNESGNYASPYYDPDKAHEYYMKHRKLQSLLHGGSDTKKTKTGKKKSSGKKSGGKKSSKGTAKKTGYSEKEKQILQEAKDKTENTIADLRDTVANWVDKQEEQLDKLDTAGKTKKEKARIEKKKRAIRNRIKAVKREMNQKIRDARKLYREYKTAYTQHNIEKFAASQTAAFSKDPEKGEVHAKE